MGVPLVNPAKSQTVFALGDGSCMLVSMNKQAAEFFGLILVVKNFRSFVRSSAEDGLA